MSYADEMIDDYLDRLLDAGDNEAMGFKRAKRRRYRKNRRIRQAAQRARRDAREGYYLAMTEEVNKNADRPVEGGTLL